jgi:hypothetical protein
MPAVFPLMTIMDGRIVFREGEFFPGPRRWIPGAGYSSR